MENRLKIWQRGVIILLLAALIWTGFVPFAYASSSGQGQVNLANQQAIKLLEKLSPEQKVGQLFLVTFKGRLTDQDTQIYNLIAKNHIGGVVLRSENDNFIGPENTSDEIFNLISQLQNNNWQAVQPGNFEQNTKLQYIPLFVGVNQDGDRYPYDQINNDLSALPSELAIGATWDTKLAEQVGNVMGSELSSLGFNLYFGPSLDIVDILHAGGGRELGTRTFGGDPYWVSEMGKAYTSGLHQGSNNRMVVIAKNFPGRGGSDRPLEEEVSTIRKSLEQLKQVELAPFFAVTGNAPDEQSTVDGLLVSHIRYQGFQGNIRATTRPVSFDQAALEALLSLEPLAKWRDNGGVLVSDDLGSKAIRRFFDPNNQSFDGRQISRNAFLAGNDLLYIDNLISTGDPDSYTTITRTLEYFKQKYIEDPVFAQKVDQAVERILTLKFRMYPVFSIEDVIPQKDSFQKNGQNNQITFDVARNAVTLINPTVIDLDTIIPKPPDYGENIVFLTDTTIFRQCSSCLAQPTFPVDAFQNVVAKNYGPVASGPIYSEFMSSYSFEQLYEMLNSPSVQQELENNLRQANWVIVSFTGQWADRPASSAFQRLLNERPDLLRNKKIIAFSFGTPYYLDSTDISKITAYYSLYSKSPANFDVAVRILFRELTPRGSLPVSVPAIGYDLIVAMSPDPNQVIQLFVDSPITPEATEGAEATPISSEQPVTFKVGDVLPLRTGEILDHNGHPVPDGTVVRFQFVQGGDFTTTQQVDAITSAGVARVTYHIQIPGLVEIRASSDPAEVSAILSLNVTAEGGMVTAQAPTPEPTNTLEPTAGSTVDPTKVVEGTGFQKPMPGILFWLLSLVFIGGLSTVAYQFGSSRSSMRWGLRYALLSMLGGLFAVFIILIVTLATLRTVTFGWGLWIIFVGVLGGMTGCLVGLFWHRRTLQN